MFMYVYMYIYITFFTVNKYIFQPQIKISEFIDTIVNYY